MDTGIFRKQWPTSRALLAALAAVAVVGLELPAAAQPESGGTTLRNRRPVRPPVIDLERLARTPRPGQLGVDPLTVWADSTALRAPEGAPARGAPPAATPPAAALPAPARVEAVPAPRAAEPPASGTLRVERPATAAPAPVVRPQATAPAPTGAPVSAVVERADGEAAQAEWRIFTGAEEEAEWRPLRSGEAMNGHLEIRTGFGGAVAVEVDGQTLLRIDRLSRVRLERRESDGRPELVVSLDRGRVEVEPRKVDGLGLGVAPVRVVTPDASIVRRIAMAVRYDAFTGTRETVLNRE